MFFYWFINFLFVFVFIHKHIVLFWEYIYYTLDSISYVWMVYIDCKCNYTVFFNTKYAGDSRAGQIFNVLSIGFALSQSADSVSKMLVATQHITGVRPACAIRKAVDVLWPLLLGSEFIHVSKRGPRKNVRSTSHIDKNVAIRKKCDTYSWFNLNPSMDK